MLWTKTDGYIGDGVNIAARIEGLAEPGGICISGSAYDQVKTKLSYEYLGKHNLKNISDPVRVYRLLTGAENAVKLTGKKKVAGQYPPQNSHGCNYCSFPFCRGIHNLDFLQSQVMGNGADIIGQDGLYTAEYNLDHCFTL